MSAERLYRYLYFQLFQKSFSQYGEDLIVTKILNHKKNIFYVDIGSNHPVKFNNTYHFYLQGHHGINIDPNKQIINICQRIRPRDQNIPIGISDNNSTGTFYLMDPHVNSTMTKSRCVHYQSKGAKLIEQNKCQILSFKNFYEKFCHKKKIDFLSIDAEGVELKILKNIPWTVCHPTAICLETYHDDTLSKYLISVGYKLIKDTRLNSVFKYDK